MRRISIRRRQRTVNFKNSCKNGSFCLKTDSNMLLELNGGFCLFYAQQTAYDGNNYCYKICNGGKPVAPQGGLDVCHFDDDCTDGESLNKHLNFARESGGEFYPFYLAPLPQNCNGCFSCDEDSCKAPLDNSVLYFCEVEKFRLADDGKDNE